jgi:uncharacterized protein (TIGR00255 family)
MIRSMTGFGRGESQTDGYRFMVEIKSVNHRFLNTSFRLPREFGHLESALAAHCATRCERGHLNVKLDVESLSSSRNQGPRINRDILDRFLEIARSLEALPEVSGRVSVESLLTLPGVLEWEPAPVDLADEAIVAGAITAVDAALDEVVASRSTEGRALEADLRGRLRSLRRGCDRLVELAPAREARERDRLKTKMAELVSMADPELERRVAQEIVLYADRVDVSEELTRTAAHLEHFDHELQSSEGAVGRKLTFLLQELHREANTVGAKVNDAEMQRVAIEMKSELEKMREQVENVE